MGDVFAEAHVAAKRANVADRPVRAQQSQERQVNLRMAEPRAWDTCDILFCF
jgi:hypothetical protein